MRPLVLAAGSGDGRVFFYDLAASRSHPIRTVRSRADGGHDDESDAVASSSSFSDDAVYSMEFNPKLPDYFASSHGDCLNIWSIGPQLAESLPGEMQGAASLAENFEAQQR